MTRHVGTYERVGVMISADLARRLDNAAWRASSPAATVTRGEFISHSIRRAVEASERGEPFDNPEGY